MFHYNLQLDTGKTIYSGDTDLSMASWQKKVQRKLLRYKRTSQAVRDAINNNELVVGWENYDALKLAGFDMESLIKKAFKGQPK